MFAEKTIMRTYLFSILLLSTMTLKAQNELEILHTHNGYRVVHQYLKNDTLEIDYFPDGQIFSKKKAFPRQNQYTVTRYYQNGQIMWERSYENGSHEGPSTFFNDKGKKILTILYSQGKAKDTLVHSTKQSIILGNYSYWSRVYGGVQNEDGSSNVQESSGPTPFFELHLLEVPISTDPKERKLIRSITDQNGDFLVVVNSKKQTYGIFPYYFDHTKITSEMLFPPDSFENSSNSAWSLSQEIKLDWNTPYLYTELRSSSVGYAP